MSRSGLLIVVWGLVALSFGCNESRVASGAVASASQAVTATAAPTNTSRSPVARVVFIDKQEACDCTRTRVKKGWDALQLALGAQATPTVDRLFVDTQPTEIEPYSKMRPMVAVPALYFLAANGSLIDQLQGEFTTEQIQAILGSGR